MRSIGRGKLLHARILAGLSLVAIAADVAVPAGPAVGSVSGQAPSSPASVGTARLWSDEALQSLRDELQASAQEGLEPSAHEFARLDRAAPNGESDRIASAIALSLAEDYAHGRVPDHSRTGWHIESHAADMSRLASELQVALAGNRLRPWLRSLLPSDPRYAALRDAYAATPASDETKRDRLRANLERWRWMPRELGKDHIYVNVPSYTLAVVDEGKPVSTYTVVVGKPSTPTPQIAVSARSVVVNPWWNVPPSIARTMKGGGGKGYVYSGKSLRQRPGPGNALGKVKIDMPNPHAIYLHDTPSKNLFAEQSRAFSHGCIRVKDIDKLAAELLELDRGDSAEVARALAGSATRTVSLQNLRPVYLVYFTMDVGADGNLVTYEDPYGRDGKLIASLDRETRLASRKPVMMAKLER